MQRTLHFSGPLTITSLPLSEGGTIGLMHCPGRCVEPWQRDLNQDLSSIEAWGAVSLVSLIEGNEFEQLGVPRFPQAILASGLGWHHIPIPEFLPASREAELAWQDAEPQILGNLLSGDRVVLHCATGVGRCSTMAAKLLVGLGEPVQVAIERVQQVHPGSLARQDIEALACLGPALTVG